MKIKSNSSKLSEASEGGFKVNIRQGVAGLKPVGGYHMGFKIRLRNYIIEKGGRKYRKLRIVDDIFKYKNFDLLSVTGSWRGVVLEFDDYYFPKIKIWVQDLELRELVERFLIEKKFAVPAGTTEIQIGIMNFIRG